MVKIKEIYKQKEKNMFWMALLVGMAGGFLGDLLVSYISDLKEGFNLVSLSGVLIFTLIFFSFLIYIKRQIKPIK